MKRMLAIGLLLSILATNLEVSAMESGAPTATKGSGWCSLIPSWKVLATAGAAAASLTVGGLAIRRRRAINPAATTTGSDDEKSVVAEPDKDGQLPAGRLSPASVEESSPELAPPTAIELLGDMNEDDIIKVRFFRRVMREWGDAQDAAGHDYERGIAANTRVLARLETDVEGLQRDASTQADGLGQLRAAYEGHSHKGTASKQWVTQGFAAIDHAHPVSAPPAAAPVPVAAAVKQPKAKAKAAPVPVAAAPAAETLGKL